MQEHYRVTLNADIDAQLHRLNQTLVRTVRDLNAIIANTLKRDPTLVFKVAFQPPIHNEIYDEQVLGATRKAPNPAAQFISEDAQLGDPGHISCLYGPLDPDDPDGSYGWICYDPARKQVYIRKD